MNNLGKAEFIRDQLNRFSGVKREQGDSVFVLCPFHGEDTPSYSINVNPNSNYLGVGRCFGCGKVKGWDALAPLLGLQPFKKGKPTVQEAPDLRIETEEYFQENELSYVSGKFKFSEIPNHKKWRTIPTSLLRKLDGKLCVKWSEEFQRWGKTKFLYFPVMVKGEQHGYFLARLKKHPDYPSYLLAKALNGRKWALNYGLWPFDYSLDMMRQMDKRTLVLVEGQRDALRLILNGIPAMCIFGTQSWTDKKALLLELAGVRKVVLFMDGDDAGIDASSRIEESLLKFFAVRTLKLWNVKGSPWLKFRHEDEPSKAAKAAGYTLWDPCNCPDWVVEKIKNNFF